LKVRILDQRIKKVGCGNQLDSVEFGDGAVWGFFSNASISDIFEVLEQYLMGHLTPSPLKISVVGQPEIFAQTYFFWPEPRLALLQIRRC